MRSRPLALWGAVGHVTREVLKTRLTGLNARDWAIPSPRDGINSGRRGANFVASGPRRHLGDGASGQAMRGFADHDAALAWAHDEPTYSACMITRS
jgi:hypothetical protein